MLQIVSQQRMLRFGVRSFAIRRLARHCSFDSVASARFAVAAALRTTLHALVEERAQAPALRCLKDLEEIQHGAHSPNHEQREIQDERLGGTVVVHDAGAQASLAVVRLLDGVEPGVRVEVPEGGAVGEAAQEATAADEVVGHDGAAVDEDEDLGDERDADAEPQVVALEVVHDLPRGDDLEQDDEGEGQPRQVILQAEIASDGRQQHGRGLDLEPVEGAVELVQRVGRSLPRVAGGALEDHPAELAEELRSDCGGNDDEEERERDGGDACRQFVLGKVARLEEDVGARADDAGRLRNERADDLVLVLPPDRDHAVPEGEGRVEDDQRRVDDIVPGFNPGHRLIQQPRVVDVQARAAAARVGLVDFAVGELLHGDSSKVAHAYEGQEPAHDEDEGEREDVRFRTFEHFSEPVVSPRLDCCLLKCVLLDARPSERLSGES